MSFNQNINVSSSVGNQNLDTKANASFGANISQIKAIKSFSSKILSTRKELENYLLTKNIKLLTSFSDFVASQSFIASSFVVYLDYKEQMEPFSDFLVRNPAFQELADKIEVESKK